MNLINITDFTENKSLTQNLDARDIDPIISEAQDFDVKPVLGSELFYDLLQNQSQQKYIDLLNGKVYTPTGATAPIEFKGLKMVLKYYVYARLVVVDGVKSTNSGFVIKKLDDVSERIPGAQRSQMINQAKSGAKAYEDEMIAFLNNYASDYPLWNCSYRKNSGLGFKIIAI